MIDHKKMLNVDIADIEVVHPPELKYFLRADKVLPARLIYKVSLCDGRVFKGFIYGDDNYWTPDGVVVTLDTDEGLVTIQGGFYDRIL